MKKVCMMIVALLWAVPLSVSAQFVHVNRQQKFPNDIPAGNYSGITPIGNDRYAVVSDKTNDGFYIFHIDIDSVTGCILSVSNEGFRSSGRPGRDQEGIAWQPFTGTLYVSGESDNQVVEYTVGGQLTGRSLRVPDSFKKLSRNYGLEALCYDDGSHRFYTVGECPARGDSLLRLTAFDDDGNMVCQYAYALDPVKPRRKGLLLNGVSGLYALGGGRLLVLERTVRVPRMKIGSFVETRLYVVNTTDADQPLAKKQLCTFRTRINLLRRNFANYEGVCVARQLADGTLILLLVADSQNRSHGILRDWLKTIVVRL